MKRFREILFLLIVILIAACTTEEQQITIFAGDSLIRNWDVEKYFPYLKTENRGVDGCTLEQCFHQTESDENTSIVLLIGTNNLTPDTKDIEPLVEKYIQLVESFQVKRIYCISILPKNSFPNEVTEQMNKRLEEKLQTRKNAVFVNVYKDFYWKGQMNPEYTIDGLHLSAKGYELLTYHLSKWL